MKKSQESLLKNWEVIKMKSDLKKIGLRVFNGFKELFVSFFCSNQRIDFVYGELVI